MLETTLKTFTKDCCCEPCCPCTAGDFKTVNIQAMGCGFTVNTSSANQNTDTDGCDFAIDGSSEDCGTFQGSLQCPSGTASGWIFEANLVCGECNASWSATGNEETNNATITVNSCDPLDITIENDNGDIVTVTEL